MLYPSKKQLTNHGSHTQSIPACGMLGQLIKMNDAFTHIERETFPSGYMQAAQANI